MSAQCFIDLFDSVAFRGERRRIYGPAKFDARTLGLHRDAPVSVRVGTKAALYISIADAPARRLKQGEQVDSLDTARIQWLEVRPAEN